MSDENEFHPILTSLPMVKRMVAVNAGQGILLASLSHMIRIIIIGAEIVIRPW